MLFIIIKKNIFTLKKYLKSHILITINLKIPILK